VNRHRARACQPVASVAGACSLKQQRTGPYFGSRSFLRGYGLSRVRPEERAVVRIDRKRNSGNHLYVPWVEVGRSHYAKLPLRSTVSPSATNKGCSGSSIPQRTRRRICSYEAAHSVKSQVGRRNRAFGARSTPRFAEIQKAKISESKSTRPTSKGVVRPEIS